MEQDQKNTRSKDATTSKCGAESLYAEEWRSPLILLLDCEAGPKTQTEPFSEALDTAV